MFRLQHQPRRLVWKQFIVRPQFRAELGDQDHYLILVKAARETTTYFTQIGSGRGAVMRSRPDYVKFDAPVIIRAGTWNIFTLTVSDNPYLYQIKTMVIVPPPEDTTRLTLEVHDGLYVDGERKHGVDRVEQVIEKGIGVVLNGNVLKQAEQYLHRFWRGENGRRLY